MFCRHCGHELPGDSKFCTECGKPVADAVASNPDFLITNAVATNPEVLMIGGTNELHIGNDKTHRLIEETQTFVEHWNKTDGKLYLPTPSLAKCQKILTEEGHLNIFGLSGQGKTALAYKLIEPFEESVFLRNPEDWRQLDKKNCKLIILDDLFGRLQLNMVAKENWFQNLELMYAYVKEKKLKIVTTCRETIFTLCKEELGHYKLFKPESCVHLSDVDCDLKTDLKLEMIKKYIHFKKDPLNINICEKQKDEKLQENIICEETLRNIAETNTSLGFPQCCLCFVTMPQCFSRGVEFFKHPVEAVIGEINRMKDSDNEVDKYNYLTLVYVLMYGHLTPRNIENIDNHKSKELYNFTNIAKACGVKTVSTYHIRKAANRLTTSYFTCEAGNYSFQHNSMLEAVFSSSLEYLTQLLLQYCDWELLRDLVSSQGSDNKSVVCIIHKRHYKDLSRRLVSELTRHDYRRVCGVLGHRVFTDKDVVDAFFESMTESEKTSIFTTQYGVHGGCSLYVVSGVYSPLCFFKRLVSELRCLLCIDTFKEKLGEALWGVCLSGDYSKYEYITSFGITPDRGLIGAAVDGGCSEIVSDLLPRYTWTRDGLMSVLVEACRYGKFKTYEGIMKYCDSNNLTDIIDRNVLEWTAWVTLEWPGREGIRDIMADLESSGHKLPKCERISGRYSLDLAQYTFTYE